MTGSSKLQIKNDFTLYGFRFPIDNLHMISALGWLYGKIINVRNSKYKKGTLKSHSLGAPTISIGNITVGGTGKTPLVAFVAEVLAMKGEKVCIISRGFRRENEKKRVLVSDGETILANVREAGDEPFELANKLIGKAMVVSDANRVSGGKWAKDNLGATCFVLDDAFQHLKAKRDLDIVAIDATNPFGNAKPLPSGILREPLENLNRADLIVITKANLSERVGQIKNDIRAFNNTAPIFVAENKISNIAKLEEEKKQLCERTEVLKEKALAFCALGNPDNFFDQLRTEGFNIAAGREYPDHHFYRQSDITELEKIAEKHSASVFLTTAKDAVKLSTLDFKTPCYVVESKMIFDNEKNLCRLIHTVFPDLRTMS